MWDTQREMKHCNSAPGQDASVPLEDKNDFPRYLSELIQTVLFTFNDHMIPIHPRQSPLAFALPSWEEMSYDLIVSYWCYVPVISSLAHHKPLLHLIITLYHLSTHHVLSLHIGHELPQKATTQLDLANFKFRCTVHTAILLLDSITCGWTLGTAWNYLFKIAVCQ